MEQPALEDADVLAYVTAAAQLLALPLDAARAASVAQQLGRTLDMARLLEAFAMPVESEMSEVFCPAPFPAAADEQGLA